MRHPIHHRSSWLVACALACGLALASCAHDDAIGGDLGGSCATGSECNNGVCLGSPGLGDPGDYPGGFCSARCLQDNDCPRGGRCVRSEGGVCLFPCDVTNNCAALGAGWECRTRDHISGFEIRVCRGD